MAPIHDAARDGDLQRVTSVLDAGGNVNRKDWVRARAVFGSPGPGSVEFAAIAALSAEMSGGSLLLPPAPIPLRSASDPPSAASFVCFYCFGGNLRLRVIAQRLSWRQRDKR